MLQRGLEPPLREETVFETAAYTNFAIGANMKNRGCGTRTRNFRFKRPILYTIELIPQMEIPGRDFSLPDYSTPGGILHAFAGRENPTRDSFQ